MPSRRQRSGPNKGTARRNDNNRVYAFPIPLLLEPVAQHPLPATILGLFGLSNVRILSPKCQGVLDKSTRSVWILDSGDTEALWRRGFFGKGSLSRSEPSWLARQLNLRKANKGMASEDVTAKRRMDRKQFKLDRANAIAAAAREAEQAFAEGREIPTVPSIAIPSSSTWRPTPAQLHTPELSVSQVEMEPDVQEEEELENLEHLQLTLAEAFYLTWALQCLYIINPVTQEQMTNSEVWRSFQSAYLSAQSPELGGHSTILGHPAPYSNRSDNPFLIHYAVYHHYRSLGWVIKNGIKFCVDYLLYKRGPVFHHAEFAIVVCPVYEDPLDRESSPFNLQNVQPFSWSWLSTINRVNAQVQKTLILCYVTIPAISRVSSDELSSPSCLTRYSVREVTLRRFIPARMRD